MNYITQGTPAPEFYVVELMDAVNSSKFEPVWNTRTGFVIQHGSRNAALNFVRNNYGWAYAARAFRIVGVM